MGRERDIFSLRLSPFFIRRNKLYGRRKIQKSLRVAKERDQLLRIFKEHMTGLVPCAGAESSAAE
jgi:hypothetical protein